MSEKANKKSKILSYTLIVVGLLLILIPKFSVLTNVAVELALGWALTLMATAQISLLIMSKEKKDFSIWLITIALLATGLYFLINPLSAVALMTWLFAGLTLISGFSSIIQGFYQQGNVTKLLIANGIIGIAFALMIWFSWPLSGVTFIGVLLGVHLLMSGIARLVYGK